MGRNLNLEHERAESVGVAAGTRGAGPGEPGFARGRKSGPGPEGPGFGGSRSRVVDARLIKLRPVREEDEERVLRWANEAEVRGVSFSGRRIAEEEHARWFRAKMRDPNCVFFIVTESLSETGRKAQSHVGDRSPQPSPQPSPQRGEGASRRESDEEWAAIGQVRFQVSGEEAVTSICLGREYRGRGYGAEVLRLACERVCERGVRTVHAYVKEGNERSVRAFEKAGFGRRGVRVIEGQRAVRLVWERRVHHEAHEDQEGEEKAKHQTMEHG